MRLIITGAAGQVGRALQTASTQFPFTTISLSRAELEISDKAAMSATLARLQPALIINAAAYTQVDRAETEPELALAVNREGVAHLADYCAQAGIPLLHLSTDYVFNGRAGRPYRETDAADPLSVYALSKFQGEQRLRERLEQHLCLRVAWVFGAQASNFARTVFTLARTRPQLTIVADEWSGPTPASVLAQTLLTLAAQYFEQGRLAWGTYHYTGAPHINRYGFAEALLSRAVAVGALPRMPELLAVPSAAFPALAQRPLDTRLDCSAFQKTFAIALPDWREHLSPLIEAWRHERA